MTELMALVKFNSGKAFVIKEAVELKYVRHGNILIGMDESGTFVDCMYHETPRGNMKAFAGREFDIHLENGEVIHCNGQWWAGGMQKASVIIGKELTLVTYSDMASLKKCYVFSGHYAVKEKLDALEATYNGEIYDYHEYEKELGVRRHTKVIGGN